MVEVDLEREEVIMSVPRLYGNNRFRAETECHSRNDHVVEGLHIEVRRDQLPMLVANSP